MRSLFCRNSECGNLVEVDDYEILAITCSDCCEEEGIERNISF